MNPLERIAAYSDTVIDMDRKVALTEEPVIATKIIVGRWSGKSATRELKAEAIELNARTLDPNEGLNGNRKTRRARRAMLARALRNNVKKIERRQARRK